jgi:hypothetical protein
LKSGMFGFSWSQKYGPDIAGFKKAIRRGNCKSPPPVIPNEVRNLKGLEIKRFLPLVEMTIDAFLSFAITSGGINFEKQVI